MALEITPEVRTAILAEVARSEKIAKAVAKAVASIAVPTVKVDRENAFYAVVLESVGVEFDALSPSEAVACQDALFDVWQSSDWQRANKNADTAEREKLAAIAKFEKLSRDEEKNAKKLADAEAAKKKATEDAEELAALRAKYGAVLASADVENGEEDAES